MRRTPGQGAMVLLSKRQQRGRNCIVSTLLSARKVSPKPKASSLLRPQELLGILFPLTRDPRPCFHYSPIFLSPRHPTWSPALGRKGFRK